MVPNISTKLLISWRKGKSKRSSRLTHWGRPPRPTNALRTARPGSAPSSQCDRPSDPSPPFSGDQPATFHISIRDGYRRFVHHAKLRKIEWWRFQRSLASKGMDRDFHAREVQFPAMDVRRYGESCQEHRIKNNS